MARIATTMLLTFALATSIFFGAGAQTPASAPSLGPADSPAAVSGPVASAPGPDCMTLLLGMADCLSYVVEGSNETKPDKACCPELKSLVDTNPVCLCELLANSDSTGFKIDYNRATKLPSVCKVDTPPVSTCALLGIPVGGPTSESPATSPTGLSPVLGIPVGGPTSESPATSPTGLSPGGLPSAGSSIAPSPANNKGHKASTTAASLVAVFVGVAFTSFF